MKGTDNLNRSLLISLGSSIKIKWRNKMDSSIFYF